MEEYKLINIEGMSKLENDHFATHTLSNESGKDHQGANKEITSSSASWCDHLRQSVKSTELNHRDKQCTVSLHWCLTVTTLNKRPNKVSPIKR